MKGPKTLPPPNETAKILQMRIFYNEFFERHGI